MTPTVAGFPSRPARVAITPQKRNERNTMTAVIKGNELILTLPIGKPTPSGSGKSLTVATTSGIVQTSVMVDGKPLKVGVNAFIAR